MDIKVERKANSIKEHAMSVRNQMDMLIFKLDAGFYHEIGDLYDVKQGEFINKECAELLQMVNKNVERKH